jgi:hypothetical protein
MLLETAETRGAAGDEEVHSTLTTEEPLSPHLS